VFTFDPGAAVLVPDIAAEIDTPAARSVIRALAEDLAQAPRCATRELFRAAADRVRERTGQKGRALFHAIRVGLTGATEGPELDLVVPAIDSGADLPASAGIAPITGSRERAALFASMLRDEA
jgi:hypothetical protein